MVRVEVEEADVLAVEVEFCGANRAVSMLLDEDLGDIRAFGFLVHILLAVDVHNDGGVRFDRSGVAEVRKARFAAALLNSAREL